MRTLAALPMVLALCFGALQADAQAGVLSQDVVSAPADLPSDAAIKALTGEAGAVFSGEAGGDKAPVFDRIVDGFEVGPQRLMLADGSAIYWGEKYQEGNRQSVIVTDASGRVRLAAAVDDIVGIARGNRAEVTSLKQYQALVARESSGGSGPQLAIFARDAADLKAFLPLLRRWLQADLLGFNIDCDRDPDMARACQLAPAVVIPMRAFSISVSGARVQPVPVPDTSAATVPLTAFRW